MQKRAARILSRKGKRTNKFYERISAVTGNEDGLLFPGGEFSRIFDGQSVRAMAYVHIVPAHSTDKGCFAWKEALKCHRQGVGHKFHGRCKLGKRVPQNIEEALRFGAYERLPKRYGYALPRLL
jgi:hypothetical protein